MINVSSNRHRLKSEYKLCNCIRYSAFLSLSLSLSLLRPYAEIRCYQGTEMPTRFYEIFIPNTYAFHNAFIQCLLYSLLIISTLFERLVLDAFLYIYLKNEILFFYLSLFITKNFQIIQTRNENHLSPR